MQKTIDELAVKLCEDLPLDITLFERNGFCKKPNDECDYCRKNGDNTYLCNKKTYILNQESRIA